MIYFIASVYEKFIITGENNHDHDHCGYFAFSGTKR